MRTSKSRVSSLAPSAMGWTDLGSLNRYVLVLDEAAAARLTAQGRLDWPCCSRADECNQATAPQIRSVRRFDDEATRLWHAISVEDAAAGAGTRRSAAYLNWRYAQHCQFEYKLLEARRAGRLEGIAVYRLEEARDVSAVCARALELFGHSTAKRALLAAIVASAKRAGAAMVDYFCHSADEPLFRELGFVDANHPAATQLPHLLQPISRRPPTIRFLADTRHAPDAANVRRWYVTKADGDQERPN